MAKKIKRHYRKRHLWKRAFQNVSFEDVIKPIFRKFVEPFIHGQPLTPKDMLKIWFDEENREVFFAVAKKTVQIPGQVRHPDTHQQYVPPPAKREAIRGDRVVVRFDHLQPGLIEVEYNDLVFIMLAEQWNTISGSIAFVG